MKYSRRDVLKVGASGTAAMALGARPAWGGAPVKAAHVTAVLIDAFSAVPPVLLVPLITLVFGLGTGSKIVTSVYIVFFVVFYNAYKGGSALPEALSASCRLLGATRWALLRTVIVPSAATWAFAAFPSAIGYALIGVVVAEFFGAPIGLGSIIVISMNTGSATDLMVAILTLGGMGAGLVGLMALAERRLLHWRPEHRPP
jgi:NitT/TauT family transport system permease protein